MSNYKMRQEAASSGFLVQNGLSSSGHQKGELDPIIKPQVKLL